MSPRDRRVQALRGVNRDAYTDRVRALVVALLCAGSAWAPVAAAEPSERVAAPREQPVGGQFLSDERGWQRRFPPLEHEGPPTLFLLRADDFRSARYGWELPRLAEDLLQELRDVLTIGCGEDCGDARASVQALLGDVDHWKASRPTVARTKDDEAAGERRRIGWGATLGADAVAIECVCHSRYFGMRDWEDETTCDAIVSHADRVVVRYSPRVVLRDGKTGRVRLEQYEQRATFSAGQLIVTSGFDYARTAADQPLRKGVTRGEIVRTGTLTSGRR